MIKGIKKIVTGSVQYDGAGVKLVRVLGNETVMDFDPFLMLDAFDSSNPSDYIKGFPMHPHRGMETITYLIHGDIEHKDSLGNKGSILDGCCQWMTAGSGILHQEMPQSTPRMLGVQIWLNLSQKDKMVAPKYHDIKDEMIPVVQEDGVTIKVIAGVYKTINGATSGDYVKITFLDVEMKPNSVWKMENQTNDTFFTYLIEGEGWFGSNNQKTQPSRRALLFGDGNEFIVKSANTGLRMLVLIGKPLKEPIAWGGPIVMNTNQELYTAFKQIRDGTFIK